MEIPIAKPLFDENEEAAVLEPIRSGWVSQGPKGDEFESAFKAYVGAPYASAVASGTAALHLALMALGVGPGDEVITTPFTCVATVNPIEHIGAKPVFVDIQLGTFNMNVHSLEKAINERTKAVMAVHLFGLCLDMDALVGLAQEHDLRVIEDAALALGAFYNGKHAGTFGDVGCFSFHPRKVITTGEGGMVVSKNEKIDRDVRALRSYGASISAWQRHQGKVHVLPEYRTPGLNYKLTDIQASLGIVQMRKLTVMLERRARLARQYDLGLSSIEWLITPGEPLGFIHARQAYVCLLNPQDVAGNPGRLAWAAGKRDELMEWLAEGGIASVPGAQAIHTVPYYRDKYGFSATDFPNAWMAEALGIALPLYPQLSDDEQERVINRIKAFSGRMGSN